MGYNRHIITSAALSRRYEHDLLWQGG